MGRLTRAQITLKQQTAHPEGKLLSQDVAAHAVRLCSARLCILHNHPTRQACQHIHLEHLYIVTDVFRCLYLMSSINKND